MRKFMLAASLLSLVSATAAMAASAGEVRPGAIHAHMNFLADDLLEGRGTASRGHEIAARYVATQYEAMGLRPGAGESYFQQVPFLRSLPVPASSTILLTGEGGATRTLDYGVGFVSSGDPFHTDAKAEGQLVYVGYGVTAPGEKYDDYAGLDVHGKIVVYFSGAPKSFANDLRAHYSASLVKQDNAAIHGAIGTLTMDPLAIEKRLSFPRLVANAKIGSMYWIDERGNPRAWRPELGATGRLSHAGVEAIFEGAPTPIAEVYAAAERGTPHSMVLPLRASMRVVNEQSKVRSPNVVGILGGSDPALRDEYVIYSAHLDHLGISDPLDGDTINNGALDNASGIAAMLEVARLFAAQPKAPRRSVIFLATTGEEKGLRGADYFANNPTVPISSLVANINIDEILMFAPVRDVVPIGGEHSTLSEAVDRVARQMNVVISPDPSPEEVVFVRSDQYPFVKAGVPAVYVGAGYKAVDPAVNVVQKEIDWITTKYHTPQDDMSQKLDYSVAAQVAKFDYLLGLDVADAHTAPQWKKGDFFGEMFARQVHAMK
jgi:hypothetical protein